MKTEIVQRHRPLTSSFLNLRVSAGARRLLIALLCLFVSACAGLREETAETWPSELPPLEFFANAYASDAVNRAEQSREEYLKWVRSFYEGTALYPRGWNDVSADILEQTGNPELIPGRAEQLFRLGRDIAAEWSKDSSLSIVQSRHLAVWGVAAGRAVDESNVEETLEMISQDLDLLLSKKLAPDAITAGRYHAQDPDDWFAF